MEEAVAEPFSQGAATGEHDVPEEGLTQVEISAVYCVDNDLVDTRVLESDDFGIKEDFWCTEAFGSNLSCSLLARPNQIHHD